jgi:hypothetical protein
MWRRRFLGLGGGRSEFGGGIEKKVHLSLPEEEEGTSLRPFWHGCLSHVIEATSSDLEAAARSGYEKVADKLSTCKAGIRRCSEK